MINENEELNRKAVEAMSMMPPDERAEAASQLIAKRMAVLQECLCDQRTNGELSIIELRNRTGMDAPTATDLLNGKRNRMISEHYVALAERVFDMSLHECIFGYARPVRLPRYLSVVANRIESMSVAGEVTLDAQLRRFEANSGEPVTQMSLYDIFMTRIQEMADNEFLPLQSLTGFERVTKQFKARVVRLVQRDNTVVKKSVVFTIIAHTALETNQTIDYYTAWDYTRRNKLEYEDEEGNRHVVAKELTTRVLRLLLLCPEDVAARIFAVVMRQE